jgi:hypothetical protein
MSFFFCFSVLSDFSCYASETKSRSACKFSINQVFQSYLCQPPPDSTRLLGTEIKREVFLALVEFADVLALLLVDDSQNARDRLADGVSA